MTNYEKERLEKAFEDMRRRIEERVPVIAEVEKRRLELETESLEKSKEIRNLQEQLREALKKCSRLTSQNQGLDKTKREMDSEVKSCKERMQSLRKLNS